MTEEQDITEFNQLVDKHIRKFWMPDFPFFDLNLESPNLRANFQYESAKLPLPSTIEPHFLKVIKGIEMNTVKGIEYRDDRIYRQISYVKATFNELPGQVIAISSPESLSTNVFAPSYQQKEDMIFMQPGRLNLGESRTFDTGIAIHDLLNLLMQDESTKSFFDTPYDHIGVLDVLRESVGIPVRSYLNEIGKRNPQFKGIGDISRNLIQTTHVRKAKPGDPDYGTPFGKEAKLVEPKLEGLNYDANRLIIVDGLASGRNMIVSLLDLKENYLKNLESVLLISPILSYNGAVTFLSLCNEIGIEDVTIAGLTGFVQGDKEWYIQHMPGENYLANPSDRELFHGSLDDLADIIAFGYNWTLNYLAPDDARGEYMKFLDKYKHLLEKIYVNAARTAIKLINEGEYDPINFIPSSMVYDLYCSKKTLDPDNLIDMLQKSIDYFESLEKKN